MKNEIFGEISLDELKTASAAKDVQGGATPTVTVPITIAVSSAFCPTTKCTSASDCTNGLR